MRDERGECGEVLRAWERVERLRHRGGLARGRRHSRLAELALDLQQGLADVIAGLHGAVGAARRGGRSPLTLAGEARSRVGCVARFGATGVLPSMVSRAVTTYARSEGRARVVL